MKARKTSRPQSIAGGIGNHHTKRRVNASEMQLARAQAVPGGNRRKPRWCPLPRPGIHDAFNFSMDYRADHVNCCCRTQYELLDWPLGENGCPAAARQLQRGRRRHVGFSTHATTDIILKAIESDGFDYVNLHWYFVNDLNWSAVEAAARATWACLSSAPTTRAANSTPHPNSPSYAPATSHAV